MKKYTIDDANSLTIITITNHFLASNLSLRSFAKEYCDFSHVTLRHKLLKISKFTNDMQTKKKIKDKLENFRSKKISDHEETKKRVLKAVALLLEEDLTVDQIAQVLHSTQMTIYRDLTNRLFLLDEVNYEIKKEVLLKLKEHSRSNLKKEGR